MNDHERAEALIPSTFAFDQTTYTPTENTIPRPPLFSVLNHVSWKVNEYDFPEAPEWLLPLYDPSQWGSGPEVYKNGKGKSHPWRSEWKAVAMRDFIELPHHPAGWFREQMQSCPLPGLRQHIYHSKRQGGGFHYTMAFGGWAAVARWLIGVPDALNSVDQLHRQSDAYSKAEWESMRGRLNDWYENISGLMPSGWFIDGAFLCKLSPEVEGKTHRGRVVVPLLAIGPFGTWETLSDQEWKTRWSHVEKVATDTLADFSRWVKKWPHAAPLEHMGAWPTPTIDFLPCEGEINRLKRYFTRIANAHTNMLQERERKEERNRLAEQAFQEKNAALIAEVKEGYEQLFPAARQMHRHWYAYLGPTNSGKTHAALERLTAGKNGIYLAPLRLLAHEIYDRLNAQGIPCNLRTGEERIEHPGAKFTAATVEAGLGCLPEDASAWDTCIIDEIQLLNDPERGWAWTQALFGMPAHQMVLAGSENIEARLEVLARYLNEPLETRRFERKLPLTIKHYESKYTPTRGDALIAFSRKEVLRLREYYLRRGYNAACIYGSLGPVARRLEAERFRSGDALFLIATDAIGMGLNLPIERVVFSTMVKYDGTQERTLTPAEIRQIAGRAGRFGFGKEGAVTAMSLNDVVLLRSALSGDLPSSYAQGALSARPPWSWIDRSGHVKLREALDNFSEVCRKVRYEFIQEKRLGKPDCLVLNDALPEELLDWASRLDGIKFEGKTMPLKMRFDLLGLPVTRQILENNIERDLFGMLVAKRPYHAQRFAKPVMERMTLEELEYASSWYRCLAWLHVHFPGSVNQGAHLMQWDAELQVAISERLRSRKILENAMADKKSFHGNKKRSKSNRYHDEHDWQDRDEWWKR